MSDYEDGLREELNELHRTLVLAVGEHRYRTNPQAHHTVKTVMSMARKAVTLKRRVESLEASRCPYCPSALAETAMRRTPDEPKNPNQPFLHVPERMSDGRVTGWLRTARELAGYTQRELADLAGVPKHVVVDVERGKSRNSAVMRALGLDPLAVAVAYLCLDHGRDVSLAESIRFVNGLSPIQPLDDQPPDEYE